HGVGEGLDGGNGLAGRIAGIELAAPPPGAFLARCGFADFALGIGEPGGGGRRRRQHGLVEFGSGRNGRGGRLVHIQRRRRGLVDIGGDRVELQRRGFFHVAGDRNRGGRRAGRQRRRRGLAEIAGRRDRTADRRVRV